jgi:GH25 family lysozyme M1 (1,4-beta-N-acetylmuramidase)
MCVSVKWYYVELILSMGEITMGKNKIKILAAVLLIMIVFVIMALTATGIFAVLYINERNSNVKLTSDLEEANDENQELEEAVAAFNEQEEILRDTEDGMSDKEIEGEESLKAYIKSILTADNGSPIKAIRDIFPENLIYYDENRYVFAPVLSEVAKHSLLPENFVKTDDGEIQYVNEGEVISHKGIDVSKYQGSIDWEKVKADGVEYAFIRLGIRGYVSGQIVLDEYFEENMRGANDSGVMAGVYFFTQAVTVDEAIEEAQFVIENLADYDVPYPIVFDVEMVDGANARANNLTQKERTDITIAFCDTIKEAGYTPMIYGNVKCFTKLLDMTRLEDYEKWYAFYDDYMYMPYNVSCWQYTEKGTVDGIKGKVDLNISYKTW